MKRLAEASHPGYAFSAISDVLTICRKEAGARRAPADVITPVYRSYSLAVRALAFLTSSRTPLRL